MRTGLEAARELKHLGEVAAAPLGVMFAMPRWRIDVHLANDEEGQGNEEKNKKELGNS